MVQFFGNPTLVEQRTVEALNEYLEFGNKQRERASLLFAFFQEDTVTFGFNTHTYIPIWQNVEEGKHSVTSELTLDNVDHVTRGTWVVLRHYFSKGGSGGMQNLFWEDLHIVQVKSGLWEAKDA